MRAVEYGVASMLVVLFAAVGGCGGDKKTPASSGAGSAGAGQPSGGASGAAGASTAGSTVGGGGSGGMTSQGGGGQAGAGGAAGCQLLKAGESGPHGLTQVYAAKNQGSALSALGIDGDQVYFQADGKVFALPVAGGTAQSLGDFYGEHALVRGGKIYAVSQLSQEPARKLFSAPLTDLATLTTLAEGIEDPYRLEADDTALYYDHRQVSSIFQVPVTGGTPVELVPGADPIRMVSHGGYLYWLDRDTEQLERVPVGGGPREPLIAIHDGGPMTATDTAIYWIDVAANTIVKWEMGATKTQVLSKTVDSFGGYEALAVSGNTVFWVFGFNCGEVHQVNDDGTGEALFSRGTNASEWLGVTNTALFVMGGIGSNVYRAER